MWAVPQELIQSPPVAQQQGFLTAAISTDDAIAAFDAYEEAKKQILTDADVIWFGRSGIPGSKDVEGATPHILKSGWRKMGRFFGLSTKIVSREKLWVTNETGKKYYIWTYQVCVSHSCGAYVVSEGVCTSQDSFFSKGGTKIAAEEDVMLKAQTVAINRGISDLLGSGEVSGEEMLK